MDIAFYKVTIDSIIETDEDLKPADWSEKSDWINIRTENRAEVVEYFQQMDFLKEARDCIEHPEKHPFSSTFGSTIILNLSISNATDIYRTDYLSVILVDKIIITVTPQSDDFFNELNLASYSIKRFTSLSNFLFYILSVKILAMGNTNMNLARIRLQAMELTMKNDPEQLSSMDLMSCERDISQLSDIIEDQYVGFEFISSISSAGHKQDNPQQTSNIIKGFKPLDKAMLRLEKKAESLRLQYMLVQQEKSTRKINVLTIIQAIFVPITFIAGVYGMNFVDMPELNWPHGYILVWMVFVGLAGGLLAYFYRKGWFD